MFKHILLKTLAFLLNTAAFGYLGYRLYDGAATGFLYLNNDASFVLEGVLLCVPLGLAILWSILYQRRIWIGALICFFLCVFAGAAAGETTSPSHVPVFAAAMAVPYLLCSYAILAQDRYSAPKPTAPAYNPVSTSIGTYRSPIDDDTDSYVPTMSHADKATYIQNHCGGEYSYGAIDRIDNDPTLTPAQKEELKIHLRAWGD